MKTILFLLTLKTFLLAQEYQKGKIDMHGGKFDSYNSSGSYHGGSFRNSMGLSNFLDKNTTINTKVKESQVKK